MSNGWIYEPETGRYYRMIGENCKEYATDYIRCGTKPEPVEQQPKQQPKEPEKRCPFLRSANDRCKGSECAFFSDGSCVLAKIKPGQLRESKGLSCPLRGPGRLCVENCTLYNSGCLVTALLAN